MHVLELTDSDNRILCAAIETRLREMRDELAHTDDRHYREALKSDVRRLEFIGRSIGAYVPEERLSSPPPPPR